jgi:hypothetical protein
MAVLFSFLADILSNLHHSSSDMSCISDTNSVYERIRLEKLTFAHRAVGVSTDPSGCNFAILQSDPKARYNCLSFLLFSVAPGAYLIEMLLPSTVETLDK